MIKVNMINYKVAYKIFVISLAIIIAITIGSVIIIAVGGNVFETYWIIISMPFRNFRSFCEVLTRMIPLTIIALGICVSSRCGINNIGAEGQMYMGIISACAMAFFLQGVPRVFAIPVCILTGALFGGVYGFIPGFLKAKLDVSELLSTVMLNYAASQFYKFCIRIPLRDPNDTTGTPMSARLPENTLLSKFVRGTSLHSGIILAVILVVFIYILLFKTTWGYKMRASGASARAAKYGGINVSKYLIIAMVISGACAGMAGSVELMGVQARAMENITSGYGFSGIVVALFATLHPLAVIPAAFFFGILLYSQVNLQILSSVPPNLVETIQGVIILIIVSLQMVISSPYSLERFRKRFFKNQIKEIKEVK